MDLLESQKLYYKTMKQEFQKVENMNIIKANKLYKDIEVKSCPFCGKSENIVLEEYEHAAGKRWKIYCCNCIAGIDRGYDQSPHELIDAWNKRV